MRKIAALVGLASLSLAGCQESYEPEPSSQLLDVYSEDSREVKNQFGFMEAMEQGPTFDLFAEDAASGADLVVQTASVQTVSSEGDPPADIAPSVAASAPSQIAYSYAYGFTIDEDKIPELQAAHVAMCEEMGERCRILRVATAGRNGYDGYGELRLEIDAQQARGFGAGLAGPAEELGGDQTASTVEGEDLSERIIDTEARLAARLVLRGKLTDILRGSRGTVDELVKAEQAVAEVNEEIDSTRSRLADYRGRIRFSTVTVQYENDYAITGSGFLRPVSIAFGSIGTTLGQTIGFLVYLATALVPTGLFLALLIWLWRKSGLRLRRPKTEG